MPFDIAKFTAAKFSPRTEAIPVPGLGAFFPEGEAPAVTVRGLTGPELGRCKEAAARNRDVAALLEGLLGGERAEKVQALREMVHGPEVPDDVAQRMEMLALGSVEPRLDHAAAVKIAECFPIEFYQLTNTILRLTGQGRQPGKPGGSGNAPTSGPPSI